MKLPRRSDYDPNNQTPQETFTDGDGLENVRRMVSNAILKAIRVFEQTIDSKDASPSEKLRAAEKIVEYGVGDRIKALNILNSSEESPAKTIARAIQYARNPQRDVPDTENVPECTD